MTVSQKPNHQQRKTVATPLPGRYAPPAPEIGFVSAGDRTSELADPLSAVGADYTVNPQDVTEFDVVVCDTPDREMLKAVARCRLDGTPVVFRQRGDPFWGIDEWLDSRVKKAVLFQMLRSVDGCLAIAPHQASKYARKTGVSTDLTTLPKDVSQWPDASHSGRELQLVTLTNATYPEKYRPLLEIAPIVDDVLESGTWRIGSWCDKNGDEIRGALEQYDNIEYGIGLDAATETARANVMLHFSRLDALSNAILEGMASRLPVVTNDFVAFTQLSAPTVTAADKETLRTVLESLRDPAQRQALGDRGHAYIEREHNPTLVGCEMLRALDRLIGGER
jgi:hypothetical protein